jgi:hypothetical protein
MAKKSYVFKNPPPREPSPFTRVVVTIELDTSAVDVFAVTLAKALVEHGFKPPKTG